MFCFVLNKFIIFGLDLSDCNSFYPYSSDLWKVCPCFPTNGADLLLLQAVIVTPEPGAYSGGREAQAVLVTPEPEPGAYSGGRGSTGSVGNSGAMGVYRGEGEHKKTDFYEQMFLLPRLYSKKGEE